jgi:glycosyltransferase involved in cell wall biosynthesis
VADALRLPGVEILPCGVDATLFRPIPQAAARRQLGLPADAPLILFVGAPRPEKRLPLIREAYSALRSQMPALQLILVHDEPRERVALYMNACDVLALASVAEGAPMVVREAMACNLPIVSTDTGDVRALFAGLPGHYLTEADPAALAERLRLALTFRGRTAGRARVTPWSLEAVAARIESIYRQVLNAP